MPNLVPAAAPGLPNDPVASPSRRSILARIPAATVGLAALASLPSKASARPEPPELAQIRELSERFRAIKSERGAALDQMTTLGSRNVELGAVQAFDPGPFTPPENASRSTIYRHRKIHAEQARIWAEIKRNAAMYEAHHKTRGDLEREYEQVRKKLDAIPATTIEGIKLKALAVSEDYYSPLITRSIIDDLLAL
jgi:hypothetical protein